MNFKMYVTNSQSMEHTASKQTYLNMQCTL